MKQFIMTAVGSLVLVGASAGITAAMTSSTAASPAVVHSTAHARDTTAISWLRSGTAGPQSINVIGRAKTNAEGESSVTLGCPKHHPYLISGGGGVPAGGQGMHPEMVRYSGPANMGASWQIAVEDEDGTFPAETIYVHIQCVK